MTGLIWMVQIVHYPLMARVSPDTFTAYEAAHQKRIGPIVGPAMLIELISALWLILQPDPLLPTHLAWISLALLILIWLSTAALQIPLHRRLALAYNEQHLGQLVRSNWIRTVLWSARSILLLAAIMLW